MVVHAVARSGYTRANC